MLLFGIRNKNLPKMLTGEQLDQLPTSFLINFIKYIIN